MVGREKTELVKKTHRGFPWGTEYPWRDI